MTMIFRKFVAMHSCIDVPYQIIVLEINYYIYLNDGVHIQVLERIIDNSFSE